MKKLSIATFAVVAAGLVSGCTTVAPKELVDARNAYHRASDGPAKTYSPTDLYEAGKTLDRAERELNDHGDSWKLHDLSYIALRKAELAEARAGIAVDQEEISSAKSATGKVREVQLKETKQELQANKQELASSKQQLASTEAAKGQTEAELANEREARKTAEANLRKAMEDLAKAAQVQVNENARGVVITLSGGVLFASGKSTVLPNAQAQLDKVADALNSEPADRLITVEGHTDSVGSADFNQTLSLARAASVRDYLVSRGVPSARIDAKGFGPTRPLVDNSTSENRANNRRVEVVIHPAPAPVSVR